MSTYSTNLALELIGTGEQAGTWGNTTNTNLGTLIEQAISGYVTQAVATGTDTTLTIPNGATGVARNMYIELTGTGGTNTNLIVPSNKKLYFIYNNSTGAVTVKVSGQTGVSVAATEKKILVSNGTDIVEATTYFSSVGGSLSLTTLTATSATITTLSGTNVSYGSLTLSGGANITGNVGSGGTAQANIRVHALGDFAVLGGNANSTAFGATGTIPTSITSTARGFYTSLTTAASFTLSNLYHFQASNVNVGAGATVTTQIGFLVGSGLNTATNNYGFYSDIASGSNRWNFYAAGTADNYFAGNVGIGTASPSFKFEVQQGSSGASPSLRQTPQVVLKGYGGSSTYHSGIGFSMFEHTNGYWGSGILEIDDSGSYGAAMAFYTSTGSATPTPSERMRISSSGNVGIAKTSPTSTLDVSGTISDVAGNVRNIPSAGAAKTSAYTLSISDIGEFVTVGSSGSITVPNDVFAAGNAVSIYNDTTGNISINCPITTAYLAGTNTDRASLTLATRGIATILFINPSLCVASGNLT